MQPQSRLSAARAAFQRLAVEIGHLSRYTKHKYICHSRHVVRRHWQRSSLVLRAAKFRRSQPCDRTASRSISFLNLSSHLSFATPLSPVACRLSHADCNSGDTPNSCSVNNLRPLSPKIRQATPRDANQSATERRPRRPIAQVVANKAFRNCVAQTTLRDTTDSGRQTGDRKMAKLKN